MVIALSLPQLVPHFLTSRTFPNLYYLVPQTTSSSTAHNQSHRETVGAISRQCNKLVLRRVNASVCGLDVATLPAETHRMLADNWTALPRTQTEHFTGTVRLEKTRLSNTPNRPRRGAAGNYSHVIACRSLKSVKSTRSEADALSLGVIWRRLLPVRMTPSPPSGHQCGYRPGLDTPIV